MKKVFASVVFLALISASALAQKVGYVDSQVIMDKIPEYKASQDEIERISQKWQKELEDKYKAIEQMYTDYQAQEVLLPEDVRKERQDEIFQAEREAKEFREKKFGYNGELFALQDAKVKPIQDRVMRSVEQVAKRKRVDFVFDKAGEVTWMYTNSLYDLTNDVLEDLGLAVPAATGTGTGNN
ncbi:MAG: OmpH family outer membrane protein [Bacteroidetes bacterium]|nr:MAG: OmpH family outer membrane protein [Bacteroidota bacterium]